MKPREIEAWKSKAEEMRLIAQISFIVATFLILFLSANLAQENYSIKLYTGSSDLILAIISLFFFSGFMAIYVAASITDYIDNDFDIGRRGLNILINVDMALFGSAFLFLAIIFSGKFFPFIYIGIVFLGLPALFKLLRKHHILQ